jgi:adenine-specific DNA-methyltransferase
MQNNTQPDTNGLKAILKHNETTQPNDELLNTLKTAIPQFFDKDGNFKKEKFDDELKKNNIKEAHDGYKLGFVGKDYARLQIGRKSETMIVPDCKHNAQPENTNSGNVFITGDNIDAFRHLVNAYKNQIKLIYIDPPYNTGKEFTYNDKFEFSDKKLKSTLGYSDEEIVRLKSIQGKSSHSAWLTFMYPRLKIAQRLLKYDGVIFISIDDNEQANLKLLMDDVFGEGNFVAELVWKKKYTGGKHTSTFVDYHEYVLVYSKNIEMIGEISMVRPEDEKDKFALEDEFIIERGRFYIRPLKSNLEVRPTLVYPIELPDGTEIKTQWICAKNTYDKLKADGRILLKQKRDGSYQVYKKFYEKDDDGEVKIPSLIDISNNNEAKEELKEIFGIEQTRDLPFSTPKPIKLLKLFIESFSNTEDIILDFFAGSSSTAHAVIKLNSEDGGNRKFIMVQLDEKTNPDSEARKAGFNTIDEIARKRIDLAGKKILADYESDLVKQTNGWDKDIGFKHYRLVTPDVKTLEKIDVFNPEETNLIADDMIKPFEYKKTETSGLDTILTTWLIDDGFRFDTPVEEITFGNYKAHYVHEAITLYLINMGWDTKALKDMLNQIGTNKLLVKTIIVYPYSFEFEAMRELKTNIQTNLDNKPTLIERF